MTFSTMLFVDRFGRVFLLKLSFSVMSVGNLGIAAFFTLKENDANLEGFGWLPLTSLCVFCIGFSSGMGSIPPVLLGEIFSDEAKKVIAPFTQTLNCVMSAVVGILFPLLVQEIGLGLTFTFFFIFCILGFIFTICVIPETKGKSLEEIQVLLAS